MDYNQENELVAFAYDQAGGNLRTIVHYGKDTYDVMYLRDDLTYPDVLDRLEEVLTNLSNSNSVTGFNVSSELGQLEASIHVREQGVILNFPLRRGGVLISLEPESAGQLMSFVSECQQRIQQVKGN